MMTARCSPEPHELQSAEAASRRAASLAYAHAGVVAFRGRATRAVGELVENRDRIAQELLDFNREYAETADHD